MRSDTIMIMILDKKIMNPEKSYATIASELNCTKQNVMYHLRIAVLLFPFLKKYIKINSSYNSGRDGLIWRSNERKLNNASEIASRLGDAVDKIIERCNKEIERKIKTDVRPMKFNRVVKTVKEIAKKYKPSIISEADKKIVSEDDLSWIEKLRSSNRDRFNHCLRGER